MRRLPPFGHRLLSAPRTGRRRSSHDYRCCSSAAVALAALIRFYKIAVTAYVAALSVMATLAIGASVQRPSPYLSARSRLQLQISPSLAIDSSNLDSVEQDVGTSSLLRRAAAHHAVVASSGAQ